MECGSNTLVRRLAASLAVAAALVAPTGSRAQAPKSTETPQQRDQRLQWWRDARFGMFIHWGPVSIKGTEIGWSRGAEIPVNIYDNLYKQFNPSKFDADEWVRTAKAAGMKYMVFTTKHHDGFCMFDTKLTDHNIMRSPFGRDVVKELAEACKRQGLVFGTYHSVCDWHHPDFPVTSPGGSVKRAEPNLDRYEAYLRGQVAELIHNYGPLGIMWFDVPQFFDDRRGQGLVDYTRGLQPSIIVNNRSGAAGDYDTPEQRVGKYQDSRPWETCMTICNQWAWKPGDAMKSLETCLHNLIFCAGGDGNLLFNVGPTPEGLIEPRQIARLAEMGAWLKHNGETIYGTRGGPWKPTKSLASTRKGNSIFLHVMGGDDQAVTLPDIPRKVIAAAVLGGSPVKATQGGGKLVIDLPRNRRQPIDTIVRLDLDGSAMDIKAIALPTGDLKGKASNVFQNDTDNYGPEMAFDGDPDTRWATDGGTHEAWVSVDLGKPRTIARVKIDEAFPGRVERFELQCRDGGPWKTILTGTTLGSHFQKTFQPVAAREVRLNILQANEGPTINEIVLQEK
jgi:alpha-L-fucosidase